MKRKITYILAFILVLSIWVVSTTALAASTTVTEDFESGGSYIVEND